ncbi:hypothetical protein IFT82_16205 [Sphingomonas sp. CFBP 8760]|nr:E2 domain-containing protein [Sphingomonas sp. CFBP 8760]MBD8548270.1 hypothetical protein [Sphingomonas sp. CFBP 8760]
MQASDRLIVAEAVPGSLLPRSCPERHVNSDGSFCLGLEPFGCTVDQVDDFWAKLRSYLLCQQFADVRGLWPTGRWLSHGEAAHHQLAAEAAAERAGLARRYREALEFGIGRLAGPLPAGGCSRRPPERRSSRRLALEELVDAEIRRREAEVAFADLYLNWGPRCCRTMRVCPIRDREAAAATSTVPPTYSEDRKWV